MGLWEGRRSGRVVGALVGLGGLNGKIGEARQTAIQYTAAAALSRAHTNTRHTVIDMERQLSVGTHWGRPHGAERRSGVRGLKFWIKKGDILSVSGIRAKMMS